MHRAFALVVLLLVGVGTASAEDALEHWFRIYERAEAAGEAGDLAEAADAFLEAADYAETHDLGPDALLAALKPRAQCLYHLGDLIGTRDNARRIVEVARGYPDDPLELPRALTDLGNLEAQLGEHAASMRALEEAVAGCLDVDTPESAWVRASAEVRLAHAYHCQGALARALAAAERAEAALSGQEDVIARSELLAVLGDVHLQLGRTETARRLLEKSLDLLGDRRAYHGPSLIRSLAYVRRARGDVDGARALLLEARALYAAAADAPGLAALLVSLAHLERGAGDPDRALDVCRAALDVEGAGPQARGYAGLAAARSARELLDGGRPSAEGEQRLQAALPGWLALARRGAGRCGDLVLEASAEEVLARECLRAEDAKSAREHALASLRALQGMCAGLSTFTDVEYRDRWHAVHDTALRVAFRVTDPAWTYELLERTRGLALARALLEHGAAVPRRAEPEAVRRARERVAASQWAFIRAEREGLREPLEHAAQALQTARADYTLAMEAAGRTEVDAWREVRPVPLEEVRESLAPHEALALAAVSEGRLRVLVVRRKAEPVVRDLGAEKDVVDAVTALRDAISSGDLPTETVAAAREAVVEPLVLPADVTRLLLSPQGVLAETPFACVDPSRTVVNIPSATVYALARERSVDRGTRVLALGDPDYGTGGSAVVRGSSWRGRQLGPLEQTRREVEAVTHEDGDVRLLGKEASEAAFVTALRAREAKDAGRWRSVHLACHGLVDQGSPAWSCLALTPTPQDDGFLTVIEVLGLQVPADLAVLSACETGRGAERAGEGLVGLSSAFLHAGTDRVLASLWKVDDRATCALMKRFYELWNGEDAEGAAQALREAQAFVAADPRWRSPRYWAAWVLWGLPD